MIELVQGASQYSAHRLHRTLFDSTGFALEDCVVLDVLERIAEEMGIGTRVNMAPRGDPHDPYGVLLKKPQRKVSRSKSPLGAAGGTASDREGVA